ncbi:virulence RhuM family protein [Anaerostipes caccae]|uniref:virulence RhuM family protein n=1 Tax=Anaerostipes caccae TaxID=105841 RepID=UPI0038D38151
MNEIEFLMYEADGKIEVIVKDETIWATQKAIAGLFDVGVLAISKHLKNIFESGELDEKVVVSILENTTRHGALQGKTQTKDVKYYNLDAIILVGYRVNSIKATRFRVWATNILREYIQKGFKVDEERMKQGNNVFGQDYFRELLETLLSMDDFFTSIDEFLKFNRYDILQGHGLISHKFAKKKAIEEYKEFNKHQIIDSDFDKEIRKIQGGKNE